jgi:hypothetical protein
LANPGRRFDLILMNTTFSWREHATNLLSVEFLRLARQHLLPGGVLYYNTTGSEEAQVIGVTVFPYGLRVGNFLAVSDSPLTIDASRLRKTLLEYRIDGRPVLDPAVPDDARRLDEITSLTRRFVATDGEDMRSRRSRLRSRFARAAAESASSQTTIWVPSGVGRPAPGASAPARAPALR